MGFFMLQITWTLADSFQGPVELADRKTKTTSFPIRVRRSAFRLPSSTVVRGLDFSYENRKTVEGFVSTLCRKAATELGYGLLGMDWRTVPVWIWGVQHQKRALDDGASSLVRLVCCPTFGRQRCSPQMQQSQMCLPESS
jgi:hypothetical protein